MKRDLLTNKQNCGAPLCGKFWVGKGEYTMIYPGANPLIVDGFPKEAMVFHIYVSLP